MREKTARRCEIEENLALLNAVIEREERYNAELCRKLDRTTAYPGADRFMAGLYARRQSLTAQLRAAERECENERQA